MAAKSWRIYNHPWFLIQNHNKKSIWYYVNIVIVIVFIEIGLLIIWTILAPLEYTRVASYSKYGAPLFSYGACLGAAPLSAILLGLLLSLNSLLIFGLIFLSYLVRNAPKEEFQEANETFLAGCFIGCIYFLGIPTVAALYSHPAGRFLALSSVSFLIPLALLLVMYVPKFMSFHRPPARNTSHRSTSNEDVQRASLLSEKTNVSPSSVQRESRHRRSSAGFYHQYLPHFLTADSSPENSYAKKVSIPYLPQRENVSSHVKAIRDEDPELESSSIVMGRQMMQFRNPMEELGLFSRDSEREDRQSSEAEYKTEAQVITNVDQLGLD